MHRYLMLAAKRSERIFRPALFLFRRDRRTPDGLKATEWTSLLLSIFLFLSLYLLVVFYLFTSSLTTSTVLAFCSSYLAASLIGYLPEREQKRRAERMERALPPAVDLLVAQYRATGSMADALRLTGESPIRPVNECFAEAYAELKSGIGTGAINEKIRARRSRHLVRVWGLIRISLDRGADTSPELLQVAEDMAEEGHIRSRKKTMVSKDVLLLLLVFCAILPFVYALSINVVSLFSEIGATPGNAAELQALKGLLLLSLPFNAYFVSLVTGELLRDRANEGLVYFPMIATASIAAFVLSSSLLSWIYGL